MTAQCFIVQLVSDFWTDTGEPVVGAMCWRHHTYDHNDLLRRPMPHLAVMTPAGLACLDCPSSAEPAKGWSRTGEPPNVTVTPSININAGREGHEGCPGATCGLHWHGHLTDGVLTP